MGNRASAQGLQVSGTPLQSSCVSSFYSERRQQCQALCLTRVCVLPSGMSLDCPGALCPNGPQPPPRASMFPFTLDVLRADHAIGVCTCRPKGWPPDACPEGCGWRLALWVAVCIWMCLRPCAVQENSVSGKRNAVGHGTGVCRYSFTPGSGTIERRPTLGTVSVSLLQNCTLQMRSSRGHVWINGYQWIETELDLEKNFAGDLQDPGKQLFMRKDFKLAALVEFSKYHNYPIILQDILKTGAYIETNFSIYIYI